MDKQDMTWSTSIECGARQCEVKQKKTNAVYARSKVQGPAVAGIGEKAVVASNPRENSCIASGGRLWHTTPYHHRCWHPHESNIPT